MLKLLAQGNKITNNFGWEEQCGEHTGGNHHSLESKWVKIPSEYKANVIIPKIYYDNRLYRFRSHDLNVYIDTILCF